MNRQPTTIVEDPDELEADYTALMARMDAGADVSIVEIAELSERLRISAEAHQRIADGLRVECRERFGVTPL